MKQFEGFIGKRVLLNTSRARYIGTFEHEDQYFVYLLECTVIHRGKVRKTPYIAVRKTLIGEIQIIGGETSGKYSQA